MRFLALECDECDLCKAIMKSVDNVTLCFHRDKVWSSVQDSIGEYTCVEPFSTNLEMKVEDVVRERNKRWRKQETLPLAHSTILARCVREYAENQK